MEKDWVFERPSQPFLLICGLLAPKRIESTKNRLRKSLKDLEIELNMDRFEQELIYYLEKYDINEEIVRLEILNINLENSMLVLIYHLDYIQKNT